VQRLTEGLFLVGLCLWVIAIRRLFTFIQFFDEASFNRDSINNTHKSHQWSDNIPHAIAAIDTQHRFSLNVWCGVIDNH
jgi:hypothetical protein